MREIKIFTDGSCWNGKPEQPMGIGVAVFVDGLENTAYSAAIKIDWEDDGFGTTSNIAEFRGLIAGLKIAQQIQSDLITVGEKDYSFDFFMDSQFMHTAMEKRLISDYFSTKENFVKMLDEMYALHKTLDNAKYTWIKREKNGRANRLSRIALDKK